MLLKRWIWISLLIFLCGCQSVQSAINLAMDLRQKILNADTCQFDASVTSDYGDKIYSFNMFCISDSNGSLRFTVTAPDSIAGITGVVDAQTSQITFDDKVLAFSPLADGQIAPACAPWVFINTLRNGYIKSCGKYDGGYLLNIADSYHEDALDLLIQLDSDKLPLYAQICWQDRRVLSIEIENFTLS